MHDNNAPLPSSKLANRLAEMSQLTKSEKKVGWIKPTRNSTSWVKTMSVKLRQSDFECLQKISQEINLISERKIHTDSEIIRGLINFAAENINTNKARILVHVKTST